MSELLQLEPGLPLRWLPDETLYSLCCRYHNVSGNRLASTTCKQLFGHPNQGSAHDFPAHLEHFLRVAGPVLGSFEDLIYLRTLLPFYLRFAEHHLVERVIAAAMHGTAGSFKFQLGLLTSRFRANHPLKACPTCIVTDKQEHGIAYWRRSHQFPGVWACPRHQQRLVCSAMKATGVARFQWILPARAQFNEADKAPASSTVLALSDMVAAVVSGGRSQIRHEVLRRMYIEGLSELGMLTKPSNRLRHKEAGKCYASFLQPLVQIDQLRGLPSTNDGAAKEIARLTAPIRCRMHPVRHLALAAWLFGNSERFRDRYEATAAGRDAVPAHQTESGPDTPSLEIDERRHRFLVLVGQGLTTTGAASEVGVTTDTGMAWAAAAGVTTPRRPKVLKDDLRGQLTQMLRRGASKIKAAEVGKVSLVTITKLLRAEPGLHDQWRQAQFDGAQRRSRHRWLAFVSANPFSGVAAARLAHPETYAWLYRNDREWLRHQTEIMAKATRTATARIDWDTRDRELADGVRSVVLELTEANPDMRLKPHQIYQLLPELKAKLLKLDRLPLTRAALLAALAWRHGRDRHRLDYA